MVKKYQKKNTLCKYLSLMILDSVVRVNKKHYLQTLLEECIFEIKRTKMGNLMNDDSDSSSSDSDSDNETDNESDNYESNE